MKQYRVINTELEGQEIHEFTITIDVNDNIHEEITLFRSMDGGWSDHARGEELIKIIDTGNGYVFPKKMFSGDVGYDDFSHLYILLSFINKTSYMPTYKGRVEEIINKSFDI